MAAARAEGYSIVENDPAHGFFCVESKGCNYLSVSPGWTIEKNKSTFCVEATSEFELEVTAKGNCVHGRQIHREIRDEFGAFGRMMDKAVRKATASGAPREAPKEAVANAVASQGEPQPATGAAGFDFGASLEDLEALCKRAGKVWTSADASTGSCSGPAVDLGFPAEVQVEFTDKKATGISIVHVPDDHWLTRIKELKEALQKKYGEGRDRSAKAPASCSKEPELVQCLKNGTASIEHGWTWRSGESIVLTAGRRTGGSAAIVLRYSRSGKKTTLGAGL